jgi:photosystem II stability/assembly factor-like uncharacterized protein
MESEAGEHPNDWFYLQRSWPYNSMRSDLFHQSMEQVLSMEQSGFKSGQNTWEPVGPVNIGGRATDMEMPFNDQNTIYLAAASGGIFKSTNFGTSWTPIFDNEVTLAIGDLDISRKDPNLIWAGTGEPNAGGGSHTYEGYGVYKSADAGASWKQLGLTDAGSIGRVKIHPTHPDTVFVAAMGHLFSDNSERGVFRTRNGGQSWDKVLYLNDSTGASDICINPQNGDIIYAAMWERTRRPPYQSYGGKSSGIWRSTDGGDNWTELLAGLPKGNVGRIGLGISASNPQVLYATYTDSTGLLKGIYKTTDGGNNWAATRGTINESVTYWWWYSEVDVDPINPNIAYVSGFYAWKTTDGGNSWLGTFANAHVDMHGVFIHPAQNGLTGLCSDDGLYLSRNGGTSHFHIVNLPITQFYTCEVDYQIPTRFYGGTQDNGTIRITSAQVNRWESIYGGDGFVVKVDPSNNMYVYAESQYGGFGRSTDGGASFQYGMQGISGSDRKNWKTPIELDPQTPSTLYFGANRLYKSTNRAVNWTAISPDLTNGPGTNVTFGTITTISVSPLDSNIIYVGTDDGNVWNTTGDRIDWVNISGSLLDRWITCVQTDPYDKHVAYVTISGYRWDSYLPHVYRTADDGKTWTDISGNLPDFPVNNIQIDPVLPNTYYIAADGGVFITRDGGQTWMIYGTGLPHAPAFELYLHNPTRKLTVGTFGRSMYTIALPSNTGIQDHQTIEAGIKAWPNPFGNDLKVRIIIERTENIEVSIWDLGGRKIKVLFKGMMESGEQTLEWTDCSNLPSGTYLIRLEGRQINQTLKIQKN